MVRALTEKHKADLCTLILKWVMEEGLDVDHVALLAYQSRTLKRPSMADLIWIDNIMEKVGFHEADLSCERLPESGQVGETSDKA